MFCARAAVLGLIAAFAAACAQPAPAPAGAAAELRTIEQAIYAPYLDEDLETGDAPLEDAAPWSNAVRTRIAEVNLMEQTVFVFNPLTGSQEDIISDLRVGEPRMSADGTATLEVRFNFGGERVHQHEFIREEGAWRLNNIRSVDWELDTLLQAALDEGRANEQQRMP